MVAVKLQSTQPSCSVTSSSLALYYDFATSRFSADEAFERASGIFAARSTCGVDLWRSFVAGFTLTSFPFCSPLKTPENAGAFDSMGTSADHSHPASNVLTAKWTQQYYVPHSPMDRATASLKIKRLGADQTWSVMSLPVSSHFMDRRATWHVFAMSPIHLGGFAAQMAGPLNRCSLWRRLTHIRWKIFRSLGSPVAYSNRGYRSRS